MKTILRIIPLLIILSCSKPSEDDTNLSKTGQFFTCEIAGVKGAVRAPDDSLGCYVNGTRVIIGGAATANPDYFILAFNAADRVPGIYTAVDGQINLNNKSFSSRQPQIQIKVSSFGNDGGRIIGSYSGTISDSTNMHQVLGDFNLKIK